jgi:hypothetical protein
MIDTRHSPYERRRSDFAMKPGLSPKMAALLWHLLTILLLAVIVVFSWVYLTHDNAGPSAVSVTCTEGGGPCKP